MFEPISHYFFSCFPPDLIRDIKDPEKPETLEDLDVVFEEGVSVSQLSHQTCVIRVEFVPTVPHCSLATLIGKVLETVVSRLISNPILSF